MTNSISILLMTQNSTTADAIIAAFGSYQVTFLKSHPTYNNYLKTLQYLPHVIVIEIPKQFQDQLHFVQMIKQNGMAHEIPVIGFGEKLDNKIILGMKKIGVDEYLSKPFSFKILTAAVKSAIEQRGEKLPPRSKNIEREKKSDVIKLLDQHIPQDEKVDLMVGHITNVMAFPFTVSMALQLLDNEKTSANDLAKIIETDPVISVKFIERANSVHWKGRNTRIVNLKDAIVRIGFTETRRLVTGMAVMQLFDSDVNSPGFDRVKFWLHCLATATIAELLARLSNRVNPDEAFLAGILHDLGIIVFNEFFPELFERIMQLSTNYGIRFYEAENELLNVNHNDVVARLFDYWKMPEQISSAIITHYTIMDNPTSDKSSAQLLSLVVSLANVIAKTFMLGASCDQFIKTIRNGDLRVLNMPLGLPKEFHREVLNRVKSYQKLVKVNNDIQCANNMNKSRTIGIINDSETLFLPIEHYLQLSGHTIIRQTPEPTYEELDLKCDIILVFTKKETSRETIEVLKQLKRKTTINGSETDEFGDCNVPIIVFINQDAPCTIAVTIPGISLLSDAIDLRLVDLFIERTIKGKRIKILPWESVLQPNLVTKVKKDISTNEMQREFQVINRLKDKCKELNIVSDELDRAEKYFENARSKEVQHDYDKASVLVSLSAQYYKKVFYDYELVKAKEKIAKLEKEFKSLISD